MLTLPSLHSAVLIPIIFLTASLTWASIGGPPLGPIYTDVNEAKQTPAYHVLGEYVGTITTGRGKERFGVQAVPHGGRFSVSRVHLMMYRGGLPGDGWTEEAEDSHRLSASRRGGDADDGPNTFAHEAFLATFDDGVLTFHSRKDGLVGDLIEGFTGELDKVERQSPEVGKEPPQGAVVLFDGTSVDAWRGGRMTDDGLLEHEAVSEHEFDHTLDLGYGLSGEAHHITSEREFGDHTLYLEFRLPFMPGAKEALGQSRGSVLIQGRYQINLSDDFGTPTTHFNTTGAIAWRYPTEPGRYRGGSHVPLIQRTLPPLTWQTLRVQFTAARFDDEDNKLANARMTVHLNGELIHDDVEVPHLAPQFTRDQREFFRVDEEAKRGPGPLRLTSRLPNVGLVPLHYRNIWIVED